MRPHGVVAGQVRCRVCPVGSDHVESGGQGDKSVTRSGPLFRERGDRATSAEKRGESGLDISQKEGVEASRQRRKGRPEDLLERISSNATRPVTRAASCHSRHLGRTCHSLSLTAIRDALPIVPRRSNRTARGSTRGARQLPSGRSTACPPTTAMRTRACARRDRSGRRETGRAAR